MIHALIVGLVVFAGPVLAKPVHHSHPRHSVAKNNRRLEESHPLLHRQPSQSFEEHPFGSSDVLLVIDVQKDFAFGGSLACTTTGAQSTTLATNIILLANQILAAGGKVLLSQDWHPEKHCSFALADITAASGGNVVFPPQAGKSTPVYVAGVSAKAQADRTPQNNTLAGRWCEPDDTSGSTLAQSFLWPSHCVQGTSGANFLGDLDSFLPLFEATFLEASTADAKAAVVQALKTECTTMPPLTDLSRWVFCQLLTQATDNVRVYRKAFEDRKESYSAWPAKRVDFGSPIEPLHLAKMLLGKVPDQLAPVPGAESIAQFFEGSLVGRAYMTGIATEYCVKSTGEHIKLRSRSPADASASATASSPPPIEVLMVENAAVGVPPPGGHELHYDVNHYNAVLAAAGIQIAKFANLAPLKP